MIASVTNNERASRYMRSNKSGFSIIEMSVIIVVVGLLIAIGWFVYDKTKPQETAQVSQSQTKDIPKKSNTTTSSTAAYVAPSGWVIKTDAATKIRYASPTSWKSDVKIDTYSLDQKISVGYGSPVYVRYSSSTSSWQTLEDDSVRAENSVTISDTKIEDMYNTALYTTGDGFGAQLRLLTVNDKTVYQFSLPATCGSSSECGDGYTTYTIQSMKNDLPEFVRSIKFADNF